MGFGLSTIKLDLELWQRGFFRDVKTVLDMGSQDLQFAQSDFEELLRVAGISNYRREDFLPWNWPHRPRCSARPFYELLGAEKYACIDISRAPGAIPHDLNLPLEDRSLYGQFDMVTDIGNNEHVFNVAETYRTMHRLLKPRGLMVSMQVAWNGNGYYAFDDSFFEGIAAANNYRILYSSYVIPAKTPTPAGSEKQFHIPLSLDLLNLLDLAKVPAICICYVLQKFSDGDFQFPYQGSYLSQVQGNWGYELQFLPVPPSRTYIPQYGSDIYAIRHLADRLWRKAKGRMGLRA